MCEQAVNLVVKRRMGIDGSLDWIIPVSLAKTQRTSLIPTATPAAYLNYATTPMKRDTESRDPFAPRDLNLASDLPHKASGVRQITLFVILAAFVASTAMITFSWPDDWSLEFGVILGPWLAIRLWGPGGDVAGILGLCASVMLMTPYCFLQRGSTFGLMVLGFAIWLFFGSIAALMLWV